MNFLLDTNVVSEATKLRPNPAILDWITSQAEETLFISTITLGELRYGALALPEGKKRKSLLRWIDTDIKAAFADRILPVDNAVMECWAHLESASRRAGRRMPVMDSIIAATCLVHDLTLVTHNVTDFRSSGIPLVNPWQP